MLIFPSLTEADNSSVKPNKIGNINNEHTENRRIRKRFKPAFNKHKRHPLNVCLDTFFTYGTNIKSKLKCISTPHWPIDIVFNVKVFSFFCPPPVDKSECHTLPSLLTRVTVICCLTIAPGFFFFNPSFHCLTCISILPVAVGRRPATSIQVNPSETILTVFVPAELQQISKLGCNWVHFLY